MKITIVNREITKNSNKVKGDYVQESRQDLGGNIEPLSIDNNVK